MIWELLDSSLGGLRSLKLFGQIETNINCFLKLERDHVSNENLFYLKQLHINLNCNMKTGKFT